MEAKQQLRAALAEASRGDATCAHLQQQLLKESALRRACEQQSAEQSAPVQLLIQCMEAEGMQDAKQQLRAALAAASELEAICTSLKQQLLEDYELRMACERKLASRPEECKVLIRCRDPEGAEEAMQKLQAALAAASEADAVCTRLQQQLLRENVLRRACEQQLTAQPAPIKLIIQCKEAFPAFAQPASNSDMEAGAALARIDSCIGRSIETPSQPVLLHIHVQDNHEQEQGREAMQPASKEQGGALGKLESAMLSFERALKSITGRVKTEHHTALAVLARPTDVEVSGTHTAAQHLDTATAGVAKGASHALDAPDSQEALVERLEELRRQLVQLRIREIAGQRRESDIISLQPASDEVSRAEGSDPSSSPGADESSVRKGAAGDSAGAAAQKVLTGANKRASLQLAQPSFEAFAVSCSELFEPSTGLPLGSSMQQNPLFVGSPDSLSPGAMAPSVSQPMPFAASQGQHCPVPDTAMAEMRIFESEEAKAASLPAQELQKFDLQAAMLSKAAPRAEIVQPSKKDLPEDVDIDAAVLEHENHLKTLRGDEARSLARKVKESFASVAAAPEPAAAAAAAAAAARAVKTVADRRSAEALAVDPAGPAREASPAADEDTPQVRRPVQAEPGNRRESRPGPWSLPSLNATLKFHADEEDADAQLVHADDEDTDTIYANWGSVEREGEDLACAVHLALLAGQRHWCKGGTDPVQGVHVLAVESDDMSDRLQTNVGPADVAADTLRVCPMASRLWVCRPVIIEKILQASKFYQILLNSILIPWEPPCKVLWLCQNKVTCIWVYIVLEH